jgi:hypothetical protein
MIASPVPRVNHERPAPSFGAETPPIVHFAPELAARLEAVLASRQDDPVRAKTEPPSGRHPYAFD